MDRAQLKNKKFLEVLEDKPIMRFLLSLKPREFSQLSYELGWANSASHGIQPLIIGLNDDDLTRFLKTFSSFTDIPSRIRKFLTESKIGKHRIQHIRSNIDWWPRQIVRFNKLSDGDVLKECLKYNKPGEIPPGLMERLKLNTSNYILYNEKLLKETNSRQRISALKNNIKSAKRKVCKPEKFINEIKKVNTSSISEKAKLSKRIRTAGYRDIHIISFLFDCRTWRDFVSERFISKESLVKIIDTFNLTQKDMFDFPGLFYLLREKFLESYPKGTKEELNSNLKMLQKLLDARPFIDYNEEDDSDEIAA